MITKRHNNVTMTLTAKCFWGELCDVGIVQEWKGTQHGDKFVLVEMSADEAEALVGEIQTAIAEARRIDREYAAHMDQERPVAPGGMEDQF